MALLLLTGLLLAGAAVALGGRAAVLPRIRANERLAEIEAYGFPVEQSLTEPRDGEAHLFEGAAGRLGALVARRFPNAQGEQVERDLMRAGYYMLSPQTFLGYRALGLIVSVILWLWFLSAGAVSGPLGVLGVAGVPAAVWYLPVVRVRTAGERRLAQIDYEMPELIDVLIVTVEAGVGLNSSLQLAARHLRGPLADELALTLQEQRMGLGTDRALANMVERCDSPSIRSFVRSLIQGESLGVSIGDILRSLAHETRTRRRQLAEEKAQKAPIKILFPLVFFIFPAIFVVILYPGLKSVLDTLGS